MDPHAATPDFLRPWLTWTAGFLAFPVAGLAGAAPLGRVDDPVAALVGGVLTGLVLGAGQAIFSRGRLDPRRWAPATALGMGLGLLLGATVVDFGTSLADLALMGALTGLVLGPAQAMALPRRSRRRWTWAVALPALWALGWTATTLGGIAVEEQFTVFGAYGAVTSSLLSGLLLHHVLPVTAGADRRPVAVGLATGTRSRPAPAGKRRGSRLPSPEGFDAEARPYGW